MLTVRHAHPRAAARDQTPAIPSDHREVAPAVPADELPPPDPSEGGDRPGSDDDPFANLVLDEAFIRAATVHEASASDRAARRGQPPGLDPLTTGRRPAPSSRAVSLGVVAVITLLAALELVIASLHLTPGGVVTTLATVSAPAPATAAVGTTPPASAARTASGTASVTAGTSAGASGACTTMSTSRPPSTPTTGTAGGATATCSVAASSPSSQVTAAASGPAGPVR
jgi:hypothetical protein